MKIPKLIMSSKKIPDLFHNIQKAVSNQKQNYPDILSCLSDENCEINNSYKVKIFFFVSYYCI